MAKMLGGRGTTDPIDAYRMEQECKKQGRGDVRAGSVRRAAVGICGALSLLSFIATFASGVLLDGWAVPFCFGMTFFLFGLTVSLSSGQALPMAFTAVGAAIAGISLAYGIGTEEVRTLVMERVAPCAALSLFVVAGAGMLVVPRALAARKRGAYTEHVVARVADKTLHRWTDADGERHKGYRLTWRYYAHGQEYTYVSNTYRYPEKREPGDSGELLVRPEDPGDVWEPPGSTELAILSVVGALFAAAGIGAMFLVLGCAP